MKHTPEPLSNVPRWVHRNIGPEFGHPNGEWVRYEDVAAEIARLREDLREALEYLEALYNGNLNGVAQGAIGDFLRKHGRAV